MASFAPLALLLLQQTPAFDAPKSWKSISGTIESFYYARNTQRGRMESILSKYAPKAQGASTANEFAGVVNDMIADFGDSHFGLFTKSDQGFYLMEGLVKPNGAAAMPNIGAWFMKTPAAGGDSYTIQMVLNGSPAEKNDLRKGDVILKVNGAPFTPVDSLRGMVDQTVQVTLRRGNATLARQVDVQSSPAMDLFLNATKTSTRVIPQGGKKYGYFHLWTQGNDSFRKALEDAVYGPLKDTDAFILDLRDGFGGRPERFADPFFRPEVQLDWDYGGMKQRQLFGYARPLVVLINKGSRSAKEVLSLILKKSKRATLIGTTTAGNVLGTSPIAVGDWGYLEMPMVDVVTDGQRLEKVGVAPDIAVPQEYDADGHDLMLQAALKFLDEKR